MALREDRHETVERYLGRAHGPAVVGDRAQPFAPRCRSSVRPGLGPNDRIGNRNATPSATSAPLMPPSNRRRRVSVPSRSSASSKASRSSGVVAERMPLLDERSLRHERVRPQDQARAEARGARFPAASLRPAVDHPRRRRPRVRVRPASRRRSTRTRRVRPSCPDCAGGGSLMSGSRSSESRAPTRRGR